MLNLLDIRVTFSGDSFIDVNIYAKTLSIGLSWRCSAVLGYKWGAGDP